MTKQKHTKTELKTLLKKSQFLKLKVKPKALDQFIHTITSLPEKELNKALKVIGKADKEVQKFAEKLEKNTKIYLGNLETVKTKTKEKITKKVSKIKKAKTTRDLLKASLKQK